MVQVRPSDQPPVPPQVSYANGQLTITASNSTLADILNAVKERTGARLEVPSSAAQERVAVEIGPGNPRDVLDRLLYGSAFDYILLGSDQNPTAVTQIVVKRREGTNAAAAPTMEARPIPPSQTESSDENTDSEAEQPPQEPIAPQPQPAAQAPANIAPPAMQQAPEQNAAPGATPGQNQVKTPQQLLQELQRMQQQEQQRRQQQTPQPPPE